MNEWYATITRYKERWCKYKIVLSFEFDDERHIALSGPVEYAWSLKKAKKRANKMLAKKALREQWKREAIVIRYKGA